MLTGYARGLFLRRLLRRAGNRVRRPARRDLAGLLDRGLPLFPARPAGRPDRRPARAATGRGRRPAAGRARAGARRRRRPRCGRSISATAWASGWALDSPTCRASRRCSAGSSRRRGAASGHRRGRHRRRHPDRRAAGARADRDDRLAQDLPRPGLHHGGRRRGRGPPDPPAAASATASVPTAIRRRPAACNVIAPGFTLGEAVRSRPFWMIYTGALLMSFGLFAAVRASRALCARRRPRRRLRRDADRAAGRRQHGRTLPVRQPDELAWPAAVLRHDVCRRGRHAGGLVGSRPAGRR